MVGYFHPVEIVAAVQTDGRGSQRFDDTSGTGWGIV